MTVVGYSGAGMSAQPCGCDPGNGTSVSQWFCERHSRERFAAPAPTTLPTDPTERKTYPIASGVLDYFPDAIAAIAHVSYLGNEQHNPGQPLHWAREKSKDQEDTMLRHFMERGTVDKDGARHTAKMAWRALAILQLEIEKERAQ